LNKVWSKRFRPNPQIEKKEHVLERIMEHEEFITLMMDALDGELADSGKQDLEVHLRACPECNREWQALLAIDRLFRHTPALSPAAGFTQRTIARLPNRRVRVWAVSAIYGFVLLSGLVPILLSVLAITRLGPILTQPALVQSVTHSLQSIMQVSGTILSALLNSAGEMILQQPTLIGWLLVMFGIVFLWGGVYRQLSAAPSRI
jgi:anti-sigma factor RsiW